MPKNKLYKSVCFEKILSVIQQIMMLQTKFAVFIYIILEVVVFILTVIFLVGMTESVAVKCIVKATVTSCEFYTARTATAVITIMSTL
jgi:hypothetical protein